MGWVGLGFSASLCRGLGWVGSISYWVGLGWITENGPTSMSGAASKKIETPTYFCNNVEAIATSNLVRNFGLGSTLQ